MRMKNVFFEQAEAYSTVSMLQFSIPDSKIGLQPVIVLVILTFII